MAKQTAGLNQNLVRPAVGDIVRKFPGSVQWPVCGKNVMATPRMPQRKFLFLQGMASQFFGRLGIALKELGHSVDHINFNGGDMAFWRLPGAINYIGDLDSWPAFLASFLKKQNITDIILFGDYRPLHRAAISTAAEFGISVYVFEDGYLRPNWITIEKCGVTDRSSFSRDPRWFSEEARNLPPWNGGIMVCNSFKRRAIEDIAYVLATQLFTWRFPKYRSHRPWPWSVDYVGGARRLLRRPWARRRVSKAFNTLTQEGRPYYLFALQLESDLQFRHYSDFGGIRSSIAYVIRSFAEFAPRDASLIITEHPLDTSPFDWRRIICEYATEAGVQTRVHFFEAGSSEQMIRLSRGLVTVNSTTGCLALHLGVPVIALGKAIYDIPGLTFQRGLDCFWRDAVPPDAAVFDAFRSVLAARTQINGCFFNKTGLKLAVTGAIDRLGVVTNVQPVFTTFAIDGDSRYRSSVPQVMTLNP